MRVKQLLLLLIPLLFASCVAKDTRYIDTSNLPTHNKKVFDKGRYCSDYLKFECLPESRDPMILKGNEALVDGKFPFYEYDEKKYDNLIRINNMEDKERKAKMEHYVLTSEDYKWMDEVAIKRWYKEIETIMEKEYPGFWGDTPRPVRHRWMRLCVVKAMKYGYGLKEELIPDKDGNLFDKDGGILGTKLALDENGKPYCSSSTINDTGTFIELCGLIGLNFDREPQWQYILDFIKINKDGADAGMAVLYIDFTVYGKDYFKGMKMTDWLLGPALTRLPYPNRPVPRLND